MVSIFSFNDSGDSSINRKSLKRSDGFVAAISGFFEGIESHTRLILILGVLGIGAGLVGTYWFSHESHRSAEARSALFLAEKAVEAETKALATLEKAKEPDLVIYKPLDVDTLFSDSVKKLKKVDEEFSRTRSAYVAQLRLGDLYYQHTEFSKALPWYQKAGKSAPRNFDKAIAFSSVGYTYENLGKLPEAIEAFQKAIHLGEASLKGDLLLGIARCHEMLHDSAKARSTYDKILVELPNTEYAKSADFFKSQLQ